VSCGQRNGSPWPLISVFKTGKKNTQTLIDAGKEVGLEVNTEKTKYMLLSRYQNAGQSHNINIANGSYENVAQFMCLAARGTSQVILSSRLMSKNLEIKIYKSKIFPVKLPVALREEHRLKEF
jgi:hypothetical protein